MRHSGFNLGLMLIGSAATPTKRRVSISGLFKITATPSGSIRSGFYLTATEPKPRKRWDKRRDLAWPGSAYVTPDDGAVFDQLPRNVIVSWSEVKGAASYIVEYDYKVQNDWAPEADFRTWRTEKQTATLNSGGRSTRAMACLGLRCFRRRH